ncbi:MAG: hypothetical protein C4530_16170 [Desulfobacteraceae bacterium]|nr:MAG: hypothetical protein C4530_16170 [Desulfobacteraceae bacterium]
MGNRSFFPEKRRYRLACFIARDRKGFSFSTTKMTTPAAPPAGAAFSEKYRGGRSVGPGSSGEASLRLLLVALGVTLPVILLFLMWSQGFIDLPLLQSKKILRQLQRVATVGPVMTSIGQNEHLKLTLQIECRNSKMKERLEESGSALRSKILMALNSPETISLLRLQDYAQLKDFFKTEIQGLFPEISIKEVYLSEIVRY